ncbi:MAG: amidohydrolase [Thermoplasmata archaeon]
MPTGGVSTVFLGGHVVGGGRRVDSLLVEDGKVAAMGSRSEVLRAAPTGADRIELGGRCLLPGLIDAHVHLRESVLAVTGLDLRGVRSLRELERRLVRFAEAHPEGPVLGAGWDDTLLPAGERPSRRMLDRILLDRPVLLDRICGHVVALNSAALEEARVDRGTRAAPGGRIGRSRDGDPDGILVDREVARTDPIRRAAFHARPAALRRLLGSWSGWGLTTIGAMYVDRQELEDLVELSRRHRLPVGIRAYVRLEPPTDTTPRPLGPDIVRAGVKAVLDGSLGARTAWLERPYTDAPGTVGHGLWTPAALRDALAPVADAGLGIALHAIGDRALKQAIGVLETLGCPTPSRLEHASVSPPSLFDRIRRTGATVVIQPGFRTSDRWLLERLGRRRSSFTHAFRRLWEAGIPLAGSSDAPVESANPWRGLQQASVVLGSRGDPRRLTPGQALNIYTTGGARALGDRSLGRLSLGGPADMVLLADRHPWAGIRLGAGRVLATYRGGRRVRPTATVPARSG